MLLPAFWVLMGRAYSGNDPQALAAFAERAGSSNVAVFVFVGYAMYNWLSALLWGAGTALRQEQLRGTLEAAFVTPASRLVPLFGPGVGTLLPMALTFASNFLALRFFFGIFPPIGAVIQAAVIVVLGIPALYAIGALFAASVLRFGEVAPVVQLIRGMFLLACGITFPVAMLPLWAQVWATVGTDDLPGFIFFGGLIGGLIGMAFWGVAFSIRMEMDTGTLEATWLTPTHHETVVIGRALGSLFWFAISQVALFAFGIWVLGLRLRLEMLLALPAVLCAILAMVGIAYLLAGIVLLIREANFFVDTANFLFGMLSGTAFPVTLLPGVLQPIAFALPTTYAIDILRVQALGARPLFDPALEYLVLIGLTVVSYPIGRWVFGHAEETMRRRGMLAQY